MSDHVVGIDLGTTHTVVAYAPRGGEIRLFEIEQLVAPGEVAARPLLPSQRYHPAPGELAPGDLALPWAQPDPAGLGQVVVGAWARQLAAQVPGRGVASAKSWLSHPAVDRLAPILPWGAVDEVAKVSPVGASASYLAHVRAAWDQRFPDAPLARQEVVLTVPASFDDAARALTVEAAKQAGLPATLRLLEEPQAAFYDWLFRHRDRLADALARTRLALVCDVGGGTTDLSLIRVELHGGEPTLTRIGVGNHLMLGGDNMDLALAHRVESRLGDGAKLSAARLSQLVERCRAAKEQLLAADAPERTQVTLLGAGAKLVGGARSVELTRDEVERLVVDGFFPRVGPAEQAQRARSAIVEFGLPYARDAAVTRHLASFLHQHTAASRRALGRDDADAAQAGLPVPDTLLLNGGVFRAAALSERLADTLADWRGAPLERLHNDDPDVAVARGAVAYALARHGLAPRIGGGSARSYFLLLGDAGRAATAAGTADATATTPAVCLLPQGAEEGREVRLEQRSFALRVGRPVRFHLASSVADSAEQPRPQPGELTRLGAGDDVVRLPPLATVVPADGAAGRGGEVPVQLAAALTEVGTLELHCVAAADPARRWKLEFQLRGDGAGEDADAGAAAPLPPRLDEAIERIERVFGARTRGVDPKEVKQLRAGLEQRLGSRDRWATPLLRRLFDALWERARGRRRSAEHERLWLNLAGWCLRPGFGAPLDDWRVEQLWTLFDAGVQHGHDARVAAEWWTLWRRVAGGLPEAAQRRLLDDFAFNLQGAEAGLTRPPTLVKGGYDDMVRLGAALERIPVSHKVEIGHWLFERLALPATSRQPGAGAETLTLWAIGRIGGRRPFHGGAQGAVPPEVAAGWLQTILALDWKRSESAPFAAAQLARRTGDRSIDVDDALRERVAGRLEAARAAPTWIAMVREVVELDEAAERHVFGEALPPGLKLIG